MSTGVYVKTKKHRENLSKALKEYWSDETRHCDWTNKIKEGVDDYWENKPNDEFVLGRRIRQKVDGKRDRAGYAAYQNEYQKKFREAHPRILFVFEAEKERKYRPQL